MCVCMCVCMCVYVCVCVNKIKLLEVIPLLKGKKDAELLDDLGYSQNK